MTAASGASVGTASGTYAVSVPGVGDFIFRRRTLRDELAITALADRLTGGDAGDPAVSENTRNLAYAAAVLTTVQVSAPDGWNPLDADPLDAETFGRIGTVFSALRVAEERFRAGGKPQPAGSGADPGAVS